MKLLEKVLTILLSVLLWPLTIIALSERLKEKWHTRKKRQKLNRLLNGQRLADVLQAAPFDYGHFQGEDGYRVWDNRHENGFIGFAHSPLEAELMIVEKYLSESC